MQDEARSELSAPIVVVVLNVDFGAAVVVVLLLLATTAPLFAAPRGFAIFEPLVADILPTDALGFWMDAGFLAPNTGLNPAFAGPSVESFELAVVGGAFVGAEGGAGALRIFTGRSVVSNRGIATGR